MDGSDIRRWCGMGRARLDASGEMEMATSIGDVQAALDRAEAGEATLQDLENAFLGEGRHN